MEAAPPPPPPPPTPTATTFTFTCPRPPAPSMASSSRATPTSEEEEEQECPAPPVRTLTTIMSPEEAATGKKSNWSELEITGRVKHLSSSLWKLTHLTALYISNNSLRFLSPEIAGLRRLQLLDASCNQLSSLPCQLGDMAALRELHLNDNKLQILPYELGKLFQLHTLQLQGNPLSEDIYALLQEPSGTRKLINYLLDNLPTLSQPRPPRPWIAVRPKNRLISTALLSVMCYNVLSDKYATQQLYSHCPSWALHWDYRKKGVMEEISAYNADIICLQEVETDQYYSFFLEMLRPRGYDGYFSPKSRAKVVTEKERRRVDGCAVFYKSSKFTVVQKHVVEFSQTALANCHGSEDMLNRVMTKDNIGVAVLLEVNKETFSVGWRPVVEKQMILVANTHLHWDPDFPDVKLIQTMMFLSELKTIAERVSGSSWPPSTPPPIPVILCADLNSLPESGVIEYLSRGGISEQHRDFKELRYEKCLPSFSCKGKNGKSDGSVTHNFHLKSVYDDALSFTNYTQTFKGMIDYIFFSKTHLSVLGFLGTPADRWLTQNVVGCPNPLVPSDHFSLVAQLELQRPPAPPPTPPHPLWRPNGLNYLRHIM